jgi:hypothetical protein
MSARLRLPNRRPSEQFGFECNGLKYTASISRFPNGDLAEIFIGGASVMIEIIYAITEDLPDGQPWPPNGMDFWAVASRSHGVTRWRRITLQSKQSAAVALGGGLSNQTAPQDEK